MTLSFVLLKRKSNEVEREALCVSLNVMLKLNEKLDLYLYFEKNKK